MNDFEKEDAAEWQPMAPKAIPPRPTSSRSSRGRHTYNRPQYQDHNPPTPPPTIQPTVSRAAASPVSRPLGDEGCLIDLTEPDDRPVPSRCGSSNPFATLLSDDSSSSATSTLHRNPVVAFPNQAKTPSEAGQKNTGHVAVSRTRADGHYSKSSTVDLLLELDDNSSFSTSRSGNLEAPNSTGGQSLHSLLDEDVPALTREEDDAWYEAQSNGRKPSATAQNFKSLKKSPQGSHPWMPGQSAARSQDNLQPDSGRVSPGGHSNPRGRGSPRGRSSLRSRGSPHGRGGYQGFYSYGPDHDERQRSPTSNRGSGLVRGNIPQRSRGYVPRPRSVNENAVIARTNGYMHQANDARSATSDSFAKTHDDTRYSSAERTTMREPRLYSHVGNDQLEEQVVADRVAEAIESDKHIQSLATQHDNAGMMEWRAKGSVKPDAIMTLPKYLNFAAALSESKSGFKPIFPRVQEISITTGTYIDPIWDKRKDVKSAKLLFYGTSEAVASAKKLISEWIQELRDQSDEKWAKVWAYNEHDEARLIKRLKKNAKRQRYRKAPPEDDQLPKYSLDFSWPLPREPERVLGPNYEALDPIRMDNRCWITREKRPGTAIFKIRSDKEGMVERALKRMQHIPQSYDAKNFEMMPFAIIDILQAQLSDAQELPPVIRLPYNPPRPMNEQISKAGDGVTFRFKHPIKSSQAQQYATDLEDCPASQLLRAIEKTTQIARYFNGLLRMHIHLGTFVAQKTMNTDLGHNAYLFSTFADMMENFEKMNVRVSNEIGDPIVERHTLARCFGGKSILTPQDAWTRELSEVNPIYAATFEIATPESQGDLILDVELSFECGTTNLLSKRWYRLGDNKSEPQKLLDGSVLNPENGLAWQICLEQYATVDELNLSRDYYIFPDTLTLDVSAAEDLENHNFVIYRSRHDRILQVPIKSVYQKRLWRFNTTVGEWAVEVGKVDKTVFAQGQPQVLFEPRWTLNVWNNRWDELLSLNKRIGVGQAADWGQGNPASLLFPKNQDTSIVTGFARQDREDSDDESDDESEYKSDAGGEENADTTEDPPSLGSFQDLLALLRQLTDLVTGKV